MIKAKKSGFTLIEIIIVIAIISILAMVAYPAYQDSITKTRRVDGQALLMNIASAQERFFTQNNSYTTDLTDLGYTVSTAVESEEEFYTASAATCTDATLTTCIIITATAQGTQTADGNLTLNTRGQKTPIAKW